MGTFYTALFQISIGLERALKVILIAEHMAANSLQRPTTQMLKSHGHKLVQLVEAMRTVASKEPRHPFDHVRAGTIEWDILENLSDFATGARYFNLDHGQPVPWSDPIPRWRKVLQRILDEDVPPAKADHARNIARGVAAAVASNVSVLQVGMDGSTLSLEDALHEPAATAAAAPYAVLRVLSILRALYPLTRESTERVQALDHRMGNDTPSVPYIHEHLNFLLTEKASAIRKKVWP